jgi:glycosyltransferase involved in cell wall biosynthesis
MRKALVSVVIPAYNVEKYIVKTLESVIKQSHENLEIIVINDGSVDKTRDVAFSVLKNTSKPFEIIDQKENQGVGVARNIGIENSKGEYIKFLDGDDILMPDAVEMLLENLKKHKTHMAFGGQDIVLPSGKVLYKYTDMYKYKWEKEHFRKALKDFILGEVHISLNSSIFESSLIKENNIRFTKGAKYGEDNEFIAKAMYYAKETSSICESVVMALYRTESSTKIPSLSVFHNVGSIKRLIRFFQERHENEIAEILEKYSLPVSYSWAIGNIAFNGYPYKHWKKIVKNKVILDNIKKMRLPFKQKTKFHKQMLAAKRIFLISPTLLYITMRIVSRCITSKVKLEN